jgi:hypothetical protein
MLENALAGTPSRQPRRLKILQGPVAFGSGAAAAAGGRRGFSAGNFGEAPNLSHRLKYCTGG